MYKITATIIKSGGAPVDWIRFSKQKMTVKDCEDLFLREKEAGRSYGEKAKIETFRCEKIEQP